MIRAAPFISGGSKGLAPGENANIEAIGGLRTTSRLKRVAPTHTKKPERARLEVQYGWIK